MYLRVAILPNKTKAFTKWLDKKNFAYMGLYKMWEQSKNKVYDVLQIEIQDFELDDKNKVYSITDNFIKYIDKQLDNIIYLGVTQ